MASNLIALSASRRLTGFALSITVEAVPNGTFLTLIATCALLADHQVGVVIAIKNLYQRSGSCRCTRREACNLLLEHKVTFSLHIAAHWPGDGAIGTVFDLAVAWDAFVVGHVEPVVECADFTDLGVGVALVALFDPAGEVVAPLVPLIEVESRLTLITIVDT